MVYRIFGLYIVNVMIGILIIFREIGLYFRRNVYECSS